MNKIEYCQFERWTKSALLSFMVAGLLGLIMRLAFVVELPEWINYGHIKHAHSHVAMLGWIYSGLYIFIVYIFNLYRQIYKIIFWLTQVSIFGMLIAFCVQGYGAFSISFSAMHIFLSYAFIINVFKDLKAQPSGNASNKFLKSALIFLFLSTIGVWAIGPILTMTEGRSAWYYGAIQFFLHYQFNGWFIFAIIALTLKLLESLNISLPGLLLKRFFNLLIISTILTYALAVTWSTPDNYIFWINSLGVSLQFIALIYMIKIVHSFKDALRQHISIWIYYILSLAFVSLVIKIGVQTLVAIPYIATISYTVRNFVIGFIHLLMLGSMSLFLIALIASKIRMPHPTEKMAVYIFLVGFIVSELLLFVQGLFFWAAAGFIPAYDLLLFLASLLMWLGMLFYTYKAFRVKQVA